MKDEGLSWSRTYPVFGTPKGLSVGRKPGVYRVRAFGEEGLPMPISRLGGVDPLGILHIGKSVDLERRLNDFRRAARGRRSPHKAGVEFAKWRFERVVPISRLYFDYVETTDEPEALRLESVLQNDYRFLLLDRPPLDCTSGRNRD